MRTSILSILIALAVVIAGPLAFAGQDQAAEQSAETVTEVTDSVDAPIVADKEAKEDCSNNADDDGDARIDCEDTDCVEDPNCKGGY
ncbi:MAG: hypothetical protein AAF462_03390 [Thermodesulfobacteriota bacterium]